MSFFFIHNCIHKYFLKSTFLRNTGREQESMIWKTSLFVYICMYVICNLM